MGRMAALVGLLMVHMACVLGAPSRAWAQQPGQLGSTSQVREGMIVESIEVYGNRRVEAQSIRSQLRTKINSKLDAKTLSDDIRRVWRLGYFEDIMVDAKVVSGDRVILTFIVDEKPAIAEVVYEGNKELDEEDIKEVVDLRRFQILDVSKVKANAEKIRGLYLEKGYYLAEVDFEVKQDPKSNDQARVVFKIREFAKVQVKRITYLGNKAVSDAKLRGVMATRQGDWFSFLTSFGNFKEEAFEADLQRITAFYYNEGYVDVQVGLPTVRLSRDKRYLYITIKIDEGKRYKVRDVELQGDFIAEKEELEKLVKLGEEEWFSYGRMRQDVEELRNYYQDRGYAYVNINPIPRPSPDSDDIDTIYDIQKGSKVYFGRIEIVGNTKTRDKVIRRELVIQEGELFSNKSLAISKQGVTRLGFFETVEITTQRGSRDDVIDATVKVVERPTGTFQAGAGFSSAENILANLQIAQNNLFGRGQVLSFNFQWSGLRTLFNLQFSEPYLFDTLWRLSINAYNFDFLFSDFSRTSTGGNLTVGYPILRGLGRLNPTQDLSLALTYKIEDVEISAGGQNNTNSRQVGSLFNGGLTSSLAFSIRFDNRNDVFFPSKGSFHSARVEFADDVITSSQVEFVKTDIETRWYFPLINPFILRLNGQLGIVSNIDPRKPVPLQERYLVGGPQTIRGFQRFSLGPARDTPRASEDYGSSLTPFRLGGTKQLLLTAEIEFPIFTAINLRGVLFADAGNAFDTNQPFTLVPDLFQNDANDFDDALRTAVGFGFRWFSPIGLLRFEWGIPLRRLSTEEPVVFEFSIGNAF